MLYRQHTRPHKKNKNTSRSVRLFLSPKYKIAYNKDEERKTRMVCINKLYVICECGRNVFLIHKYASMGYEIIILNEQPEKLEESKSYGLRLPFIVSNGKASTI